MSGKDNTGIARIVRFDKKQNRLVFLKTAADQNYWEGQWDPLINETIIRKGNRFVTNETKACLQEKSKVLDAGCGIAATVYGLNSAGFTASGIDYAENTISAVKKIIPALNLLVGDVRQLPFSDESLDGIWSLGVIEHFYEGFDSIISEANRVLKPGGYLFLTTPIISLTKSFKIKWGMIKEYDEAKSRNDFFQFAFRNEWLTKQDCFENFNLTKIKKISGALGFSEDFPELCRFLKLSPSNKSTIARAYWRAFDSLLTPFSFHMRFYRFRKKF